MDPIRNHDVPGAGAPPPRLTGHDLLLNRARTTLARAMLTRVLKGFLRVPLDRLTPCERDYLRAMAELGSSPHRSGDVAVLLGISVTSAGPLRAGLRNKGVIYSPAHGDTAFTVPLFDGFKRRTITDPPARALLADGFDQWQGAIAEGLRRLHQAGQLADSTDPDALAVTLLATLQGGLLLAQVQRDTRPLETAVDTLLQLAARGGGHELVDEQKVKPQS